MWERVHVISTCRDKRLDRIGNSDIGLQFRKSFKDRFGTTELLWPSSVVTENIPFSKLALHMLTTQGVIISVLSFSSLQLMTSRRYASVADISRRCLIANSAVTFVVFCLLHLVIVLCFE